MNDSADEAVPEASDSRPRPPVPAGREPGRDQKRRTGSPSGMVLFQKDTAGSQPPPVPS